MEWGTVIVAALTAILGFAGNALGTFRGHQLTAYRVEQLEKKVGEHNNFARRMPVVEEQIKVINHRVSDLEREKEK